MASGNDADYILKYIIIGDASVGKSNLLLRYVYGEFKQDYQVTLGVEFAKKNVEIGNKIYRIQIWDTAGQESFKSITRTYYKSSACALIVYDISCRESFNNVTTWIDDCKAQTSKNLFMILIGNKSDLEDKREVSNDEGRELAEKYGLDFFETSAKTGANVNEMFFFTAESIAKKIEQNSYDLESEDCGVKLGNKQKNQNKEKINLDNSNKKIEKKKCC